MKHSITIEDHSGITVIRDDLLGPGGTKTILMQELCTAGYSEYVYASTVYGGLQIALAQYCKKVGKKAVIFCAKRKSLHRNTLACKKLGAKIIEVPDGMLVVVTARAREYCQKNKALQIQFGGRTEACKKILTQRIRQAIAKAGREKKEIWCVIGSGMLLECIIAATTKAHIFAVKVSGSSYSISHSRVTVIEDKRPFGKESRFVAPFPSMPNYDLKGYEHCTSRCTRGSAIFWNVAG